MNMTQMNARKMNRIRSSVQPPSPPQAGLLEEWMVEREGEVEEEEGELIRPKPEKGFK